jgi:hypothetical protein
MMDGGDLAEAAEGRLPGTAYHAPQVRIVTPVGQPLTVGNQPVSPDIVSATVTLPATGVGQAAITLNNHRHSDAHRPIVPVWRYNNLGDLSFGTRFRIDFRYGNDGWTPMILARVTDLEFSFPAEGGAQTVVLKAEDLVSLLKVKPPDDNMYIDFHETEIVEMEVQDVSSDLSMPAVASPFSEPLEAFTRKKAKTHFDTINAFAERMDFEVFAAFENEGPTSTPNGAEQRPVKFHFEPARSGTLDKMVTLHWGRDIIDFKPKFSVWSLPTEAVARGAKPRERGEIEERVTVADDRSVVITDLHPAPGKPIPLDAYTARDNAFDDENRPQDNSADVQVKNIDSKRARMAAIAALRRGVRQFLTADIATIGFTRLHPGIHVNLTGFEAPFDGIWYVTQAVHTLNAKGYITKISLRRPGMLDPSTYPGAAA